MRSIHFPTGIRRYGTRKYIQVFSGVVMMKHSVKVQHCIESICNQGCQSVGAIIEQLEAGEDLQFTRSLTANERQIVLQELKSVMDVYAKRGCPTDIIE